MQSDSVAIFSGGLDSTTLVYELINQNMEPHLLSFNYGQRHKKELDYASNTAFKLGLRHDIVDLTGITHLISNSALTSKCICNTGPNIDGPDRDCPQHGQFATGGIEVPEGHYAEDTMKKTVVPNRNMIMLSIAAGVAVSNNYKCIATGVHAGDHFVYPDCRPDFIRSVDATIRIGNDGFGPFADLSTPLYSYVYAPFMNVSKTDIAKRAFELEVPFEDTWSCYKGDTIHCGKCGTCVERLEAIHDAAQSMYGDKAADQGFFDNTQYADNDFWRQAVASR